MEYITSVNNEKVKHAASLNNKKDRRFSGTFLVEGYKLVKEVISGAAEVVCLYVTNDGLKKYGDLVSKVDNTLVLSDAAFSKISYTDAPQGIIAEVRMRPTAELVLDEPFLILDTIQDPGNLGTIIRTAAAVGYRNLILIDCVDPYSPKVVRASSGGIFYTELYQLSLSETIDEVVRFNARLYVADMNGENVFSIDRSSELYGLVIGSEGRGVCEELKRASARVLSLPMKSQMESLNAAVSASVIMYQLKKDEI